MEIVYFDADVPAAIQDLASLLLSFASAIALLVLVGAGVYYMQAGADPEKQKRAKNTIAYAIIGLLICVLSYSMLKAVEQIAAN